MQEHWQYRPGDVRANLFVLAIAAISMVPAVVVALAAREDVLTRYAVLRGYGRSLRDPHTWDSAVGRGIRISRGHEAGPFGRLDFGARSDAPLRGTPAPEA